MEMEQSTLNSNAMPPNIIFEDTVNGRNHLSQSSSKPFIEANTVEVSLTDLKDSHIIPVFVKDNSPLISHSDFIECATGAIREVYPREEILSPSIRVSHPIKGRIPEAKSKPANDLEEWEKTLYYERMAFIIELPSVSDSIDGNQLSLTIGGIKAYNLDNLYSKKGADEHFKIFIGFKNAVCTNLCVWSDGLVNDLKISNIGQLVGCMKSMMENYNAVYHLNSLRKLNEYSLTEAQFAHLIGKCRMYLSLPHYMKKNIHPLHFGDNQVSAVVKDYYKDESFCRDDNGNINLWRLYNLFTGVNKSSYIDNFLEKLVNGFTFVENLRWSLDNKAISWFLS